MKKLKDKITNVAGLVFLIGGSIVTIGATGGLALPIWLMTGAGVATSLSGAVIGYLTGKTPDGKPIN